MKKEYVVGKKLREYRGNRTQAEMAALLDITPNYYGEMERGNKLPSFDMLLNFIRVTGKDANYWCGIESSQEIQYESSGSHHNTVPLSVDKMSLDTLSAFFRDRVKHEIDDTRGSTLDRIREDISDLYIFVAERKKKEERIA